MFTCPATYRLPDPTAFPATRTAHAMPTYTTPPYRLYHACHSGTCAAYFYTLRFSLPFPPTPHIPACTHATLPAATPPPTLHCYCTGAASCPPHAPHLPTHHPGPGSCLPPPLSIMGLVGLGSGTTTPHLPLPRCPLPPSPPTFFSPTLLPLPPAYHLLIPTSGTGCTPPFCFWFCL